MDQQESQKYNSYIEQITSQLEDSEQRRADMSKYQKVYSNVSEENLIKFQLSLTEVMEDIYHLLRGDVIVYDGKGNYYYDACDDKDRPFNDFGVQRIMNILSFYSHKGVILSYWLEPEDFTPALTLICEDIADYIAQNFYKMGMDTEDKITMYPIIFDALKDNIHSAFRRALFGRELNSLRTARLVSQRADDGMQQANPSMINNNSKKSKWFNPLTWGR